MKSGTLGRTGLAVSKLALAGSYGIDAEGTERAFHELGITTFFVTPRMKGLVEGVRRLVAAGHRDRLVLIGGAGIPLGFSVGREFKKAATSLGIERFDAFLLFWVQAHWYVTGNTWPALRKLKDELDLDVLMIRYNAAHRGAEREIFDTLEPARRPGIVAYTATRWGRLLKPASGLGPMSPGECYRFSAAHPMVDTVLTGPASFDELAASARDFEVGPLAPARLEEVRRFGDAVRATATGRMGFLGA